MTADPSASSVAVVGAGVFGAAAALALRRRGRDVALLDPGPLPHPRAASTDISKIVRIEYGADEDYMALAERALAGWARWAERWPTPLFHRVGVLMMSRAEMTPGGFEFESFRLLRARGHLPERMDGGRVADRFPAWRGDLYPDGFFHAGGGYAESGRVVAWMIEEARRRGVEIREGFRFSRWIERKGRIAGVESDDGQRALCDDLVLAAGAWTGRLHPELRDELRPVAQPVFHLKPRDPDPFRADRFPVFAADIARTGWYGFPANADGIVKVANHGPGREVDPDGPRDPAPEDERALRDFLDESFPALADAPIVERRLCLYSDSRDGHFWIARDPNRPGLTIAAGGSGHGFKFAPVIGDPIADAVEGIANEFTPKFRWRPGLRLQRAEEEARCHGAEYVKRLTD